MTREHSSLSEVRSVLVKREEFHPFPGYSDREAWDTLPTELRKSFLAMGPELLNFETTALTASKYLRGYRDGTDAPYNGEIFPRRNTLLRCAVCECMEHKGKYLDKIVDLIWAICEESSWVIPNANNHMHNYMWSGVMQNALPDVTDFNFVDLIAGGTASTLAWVYYLLKEPLDEISPLVCERIELELFKRIVIPFMHHDDLTWFGCYGHKINNWNPWITGEILCADLICVKDPDLRAKVFARALDKLEIYIGVIPPDGGCDEGPGYWAAAGAALYDCFSIIAAGTNGRLSFLREPLLRNVGEYVAKANLTSERYANFADNGPTMRIDSRMLLRFGRDTGSDFLTRFALARHKADAPDLACECSFLLVYRFLGDLFCAAEADALAAEDAGFQPGCWFLPDTQLLFARDYADRVQFAAKGGFNNESHNHNDLGSFMYLKDGETVIADLGHLPYESKTFSPYRYTIWILTSEWHSCARIAGYPQHDGDEYKARVVGYAETERDICLSLELAGAYEAAAGVESYVRTFRFDRDSGALRIRDEMTLTRAAEAKIRFITVREPKEDAGAFRIPAGKGEARLTYSRGLIPCVERHDLEKENQYNAWGSKNCWRVTLTSPAKTRHVFETELV